MEDTTAPGSDTTDQMEDNANPLGDAAHLMAEAIVAAGDRLQSNHWLWLNSIVGCCLVYLFPADEEFQASLLRRQAHAYAISPERGVCALQCLPCLTCCK